MASCMSIVRQPVRSFIKAGKIISSQPVRFRWKPPDKDAVIYPTFSERLEEWKSRYEKPASAGVNIGFDFKLQKKSSARSGQSRRERKKELEAAARHRKLCIDMDVMREVWNEESMPLHASRVAEHYGIFHDMFDGAHFHPVVPIKTLFDYDDELITPVYHGNIIPASDVSQAPSVLFDSDENSRWTLVMSSPDGNLEENSKEILHWAVCNIPGNAVDKGEKICEYLQPFPPRGAGLLRYVFILYKQEGEVDFGRHSNLANSDRFSLRERHFSTHEFYKNNQDSLTPAGLAFFQSEWDKSVTSVFHNVLGMKEPVFEFLHPPEYLPEQRQFPHREPFNLYMDMYRDVKDLQQEVLKLKLSNVDPTKPPAPRPKYPNAEALPHDTASWVRERLQHQRLGKYQWRDLYEDRD